MAKIYAVRHAESIANTMGIYQGQTYDTGLSDLGIKQATALAWAFEGKQIEQIISSPLKRTIQTANVVAKKLGLTIQAEKELIETNHGEWEGHGKSWIETNFPEILITWQTKPAMAKFPNGETFMQTIDRVGKYIFHKSWDENTLLVTHDNIVRILVAFAKNLDMNDIWEIDTDPAGITEFEIVGVNGEKKLKVVEINNVEHLADLRSDLNFHAL